MIEMKIALIDSPSSISTNTSAGKNDILNAES